MREKRGTKVHYLHGVCLPHGVALERNNGSERRIWGRDETTFRDSGVRGISHSGTPPFRNSEGVWGCALAPPIPGMSTYFARTDSMDHLPKPDHQRTTVFSYSERRRAVRVELCGELHAQAAALDLPVLLLDISKTGFSMHSTFDFMVDSTHDFRFTPAADPPACMILTARVVQTTVRKGGNRKPSYVVGLEFMDRADERVDFAIRRLLAILAVAGVWSDADGAD